VKTNYISDKWGRNDTFMTTAVIAIANFVFFVVKSVTVPGALCCRFVVPGLSRVQPPAECSLRGLCGVPDQCYAQGPLGLIAATLMLSTESPMPAKDLAVGSGFDNLTPEFTEGFNIKSIWNLDASNIRTSLNPTFLMVPRYWPFIIAPLRQPT